MGDVERVEPIGAQQSDNVTMSGETGDRARKRRARLDPRGIIFELNELDPPRR